MTCYMGEIFIWDNQYVKYFGVLVKYLDTRMFLFSKKYLSVCMFAIYPENVVFVVTC